MALIQICLHALLLIDAPLRALSCLPFSRVDSVGHYSPEEDTLLRLIRSYSVTTIIASLVTIRLSHSYKVSHATIPFLIHDPPIGKG